ncbi:MAG: urease accessory protein UreJ [Hyphomicrobiales bacterium]|nr:MAG: urease accessory protein UreJ [Hyphomicrobiales bacterium]
MNKTIANTSVEMRLGVFRLLVALAVMLAWGGGSPALAHHMMDGEVPRTAMQGLLSGLGHPIIGIDHIAFVIGVGVLARASTWPVTATALFVLATGIGCLARLSVPTLPYSELAVLATLLLAAGLIQARRIGLSAVLMTFLPLAGLVHGYAYGESIIGAEAGALGAYIVGFIAVQFAIAALSGVLFQRVVVSGRMPEAGALRLASIGLVVVALASFATGMHG